MLKNTHQIDKDAFLKFPKLISFLNETNTFSKYKIEVWQDFDNLYLPMTNNMFIFNLNSNLLNIFQLKFICLNDELEHKLYKQAKRAKNSAKTFLNTRFPNKSQFEI